MMGSAIDAYEQMLDDLVEATLKAWEDFEKEIRRAMDQIDSEIARNQGIIGSEGKAPGDIEFWASEIERLKKEAETTWKDLVAETDPAKRLALWQQLYQDTMNQMNAELSASQAHFNEMRRLRQESYDEEVVALTKKNEDIRKVLTELGDLFSKKEGFLGDIDSTLEDVRTAGPGGAVAEFNATRMEIARIKGALGTATGDEKEDLLYDLKKQYDKLWKYGGQVYKDDWKAFARLQEEMTAGLTELRGEGEHYFDTEIEIYRQQLEALTEIKQVIDEDWENWLKDQTEAWDETYTNAMRKLEKDLKLDMENIAIAEAKERIRIYKEWKKVLDAIADDVGFEATTLEWVIRTAFDAALREVLEGTGKYATDIDTVAVYIKLIYELLGGVSEDPPLKEIGTMANAVSMVKDLASQATGKNKTSLTGWAQELEAGDFTRDRLHEIITGMANMPDFRNMESRGLTGADLSAFLQDIWRNMGAVPAPKWSDYIDGLSNTQNALSFLQQSGISRAKAWREVLAMPDSTVSSQTANEVQNLIGQNWRAAEENPTALDWINNAFNHELPWLIGKLGDLGYKQGGPINEDGWKFLHRGEEIYNPAISGRWGREGMETRGMMNSSGSKTIVPVVFIPYPISKEEQDRIVREEVKPRLQEISENEQFLYDNAIIKTNTGI